MSADTLREHLGTFGLSAKEIDAYLAILRAGEATTGEVSTAADVSQGYVYEIAEALVERDLVVVDETASPTVLRARPPEEALGALSSRLEDLRDSVESLYTAPADDGAAVEIVHSRATVRARIERYLDDATEEAFLVLPAPEIAPLEDALADVTLVEIESDTEERHDRVPVVGVRQNLVGDPTNDFPMENSLVFELPDGRVAAGNVGGGIGPFYEGYGASSVRLYEG